MKLLNGEFWWLRRWLLWIWVTLCVTNYFFTLLQSKHVNSFCLFCPFWHIHKEIVTWLLYNTLPYIWKLILVKRCNLYSKFYGIYNVILHYVRLCQEDVVIICAPGFRLECLHCTVFAFITFTPMQGKYTRETDRVLSHSVNYACTRGQWMVHWR